MVNARRAVPIVVVVMLILAVTTRIPLDTGLESLRAWVSTHGAVGMLGFGAAYVALALVLVPGVALTLIAGAVFGPIKGVLVVAVATSVTDAVAFLLARHILRGPVESLIARYPRFRAIDRVIAKGGWRVVALLRLNPTVPYSVSNYLFGATAVPILPYLIASGLFTLPGAFLYVYLGYVGAETLGGPERTTMESAILVVGLAATGLAVVYVTRLTRLALREIDG
jgi:uncharacterized membrane protein YdjX (TVP38/TMEM64 family)